MPNKKSIILESVRKLIALGLSDEEIVKNLVGLGLRERDARTILSEARGQKEKTSAAGKPLPKPEPPAKEEQDEFPESEEELMQKLSAGLGEEKPARKQPVSTENDAKRLKWEKETMRAVNSQLEEMKRLKLELDAVLEQKIHAGLESEYKKISALINSKTVLMSEKINADLEKKHKQIDELLDQRVKEVLKINNDLKKNLSDLDKWEKKYRAVQAEISGIEKTIREVKAGGLKELEGKSKKSVNELLALIKRANSDLKTFIEKTKGEIEEKKIAASTEISQLGASALKDIRLEAENTRKELESEYRNLIKELREEEGKRAKELSEEQMKKLRELDLELEQKRDATIEKLDEIVEERLDLTQRAFRELKDKLLKDVEIGAQESRAETTEFVAKAQAEIKRLDNRVTKTLELESEVIEDIMNEAKEKIERVKLESQRDLEAKISKQMRALKILQSNIDPERASKRIAELERTKDKIRQEISRKITEKVQDIDREYAQKIKIKLREIETNVGSSSKKLDEIIARADKEVKELNHVNTSISTILESKLKEFEKSYNEKVKPKVEEIENLKVDTIKAKERFIAQVSSENAKFRDEMKSAVAKHEAQLNALTKEAALLINQKAAILKGLEPYSQMDLGKIEKYVVENAMRDAQASIRLSTKASVAEIQRAKEEAKKEALQSVGVDQIQAQVKQLNLFKQQFLKAIDKNIEQFNKRIQKFNETTKQMEDHFNIRVKMIDQKMDELNNFEKNFARAIGASLEKMSKANAVKTDKK